MKNHGPVPNLVAVPMSYAHERYLGRPSCPKCGEMMMAPSASEYRDGCGIRHAWVCDACDYGFETLICLDAATAKADAPLSRHR
jgi:hypothetical protein